MTFLSCQLPNLTQCAARSSRPVSFIKEKMYDLACKCLWRYFMVCPSSSPTVRTWVVACKSTPVRLSVPHTHFSSNSIPECFPFSASKVLAMCEIKRGRWSYNCFDIFKISYSLFANDIDRRGISIRTTKCCSHQTVLSLDFSSAVLFMLHLPTNHQIK